MSIENLKIAKLKDSLYASEAKDTDGNVIYCEIKYKRDRSSFAGIAFKLNENNNIIVRECEEKVIHEINKFEKLYIGCELDYINSIQEFFSTKGRNYGIEILFLVYSDIRSSQIIFEKLMKCVDESMEEITKLF